MIEPIWPTPAIARAKTYAFTTRRSVVVVRMNTPCSANSKYTFPRCRVTICTSDVMRSVPQRAEEGYCFAQKPEVSRKALINPAMLNGTSASVG